MVKLRPLLILLLALLSHNRNRHEKRNLRQDLVLSLQENMIERMKEKFVVSSK